MKHTKRILLLLLMAAMVLTLTGCKRNRVEAPTTAPTAQPTPAPTVDPQPVVPENEDILLPQASILG